MDPTYHISSAGRHGYAPADAIMDFCRSEDLDALVKQYKGVENLAEANLAAYSEHTDDDLILTRNDLVIARAKGGLVMRTRSQMVLVPHSEVAVHVGLAGQRLVAYEENTYHNGNEVPTEARWGCFVITTTGARVPMLKYEAGWIDPDADGTQGRYTVPRKCGAVGCEFVTLDRAAYWRHRLGVHDYAATCA